MGRKKERVLGQVGGGMRARWTRRRALPGVSALKGEALGGRFLRGTEPGKEGDGVCARPLLPEDPVFESGVRVGGAARGRLSAFRPEEERLDPKKVTQAPLGTLGTLGLRQPSTPKRPLVPRGRGYSLGGAAGKERRDAGEPSSTHPHMGTSVVDFIALLEEMRHKLNVTHPCCVS